MYPIITISIHEVPRIYGLKHQLGGTDVHKETYDQGFTDSRDNSHLRACFTGRDFHWASVRFSAINLALKNSRNLASLIIEDIDVYMMKGDTAEVDKYISQLRKNPFVLDLKVFNEAGKDSKSGDKAASNSQVLKALQDGKNIEERSVVNGMHTMITAVPLVNEEKCKGCHDAAPKYLGGLLLSTLNRGRT